MTQKKTPIKTSKKAPASKLGLGRGLSSLMDTREAAYENIQAPAEAEASKSGKEIPIEFLVANEYQPRVYFDDDKAKELLESVKAKGILQPILVRSKGKDRFEIIAGERRWRAAQAAGLHEVPVVVMEMSDEEALEVAIIENIQRHDLNPIEEALGYKRLMDEFSHTQDALGKAVGKSRSHVANILRLLALPKGVQKYMQDGSISMGHARALITADDPAALAKQVVKNGLSVRQTEQLAKAVKGGSEAKTVAKSAGSTGKDVDTLAFEHELSTAIGLKVELDTKGVESGVLKIHYKSLDQLDDICAKINNDS
ncbi:MAG: ParB/RepB/Spo0J family partition protein [Emcibacteraceae bacterium]|nr:ParB/RepB/Spo0J family partition protein [Emcibacteraceae bacterium]